MREQLVDSILGCIVGGAIGDAAGSAFEGAPSTSEHLDLLGADWRLTDDTQLTLATCEAVISARSPDPAVIAASFLRWFRARRITGMGASTLKALRDLEVGGHWALAGRRGERAAGNGAAMRIAPLAFCVDAQTEESRRLIRDVCRITHHNDEAYTGALAVVLAIQAANNDPLSLDSIIACLPDTSVRDRLATYASLPPKTGIAELAQCHGSSGYVVESVPFALFAVQRLDEIGFEGLLSQVIAAGGDTDTNASIVGQIAGTRLGLSGLPQHLVARLPDAETVLGTAKLFADKVVLPA